ncbi:MAG: hypothetical protein ABDH23_04400 [Endomicrobiia bacterium]
MKKLIVLFIFAVTMGVLEAAVEVYVREIYYPFGFFPLNLNILPKLFRIEILKEVSTIIILISISLLYGKTFIERFCYFLFSFGTWDIIYYIGLKFFINWPENL